MLVLKRSMTGIVDASVPSKGLRVVSTVPAAPSGPVDEDLLRRSRWSYRASRLACHGPNVALSVVPREPMVLSLLLRSGRSGSLSAR